MSHLKRIVGLLALSCVLAVLALTAATAGAEEYWEWQEFCVGNRTSHGNCEGPRKNPKTAINRSTNGGWSWSWVWNEAWGSDANSCQSGNCESWAEVGGWAYGKVQMSNIAGKTYYFRPEQDDHFG